MRTPLFDRLGDDHVFCPSDASPLHNRLPHSPSPEDEHRGAGPDLGGVEGCADTGLHGATDHTRDVEWRVVGNLDGATRRNHGVFGKGADAESAVNEIAAQAERRRPVRTKVVNKGEGLSAFRPCMTSARSAFAAGGERGEHHLVAHAKMFDPSADVSDLTCGLVAEHDRHAVSCVDHGQIGVADPAVEHPHEHLTRSRRLDLKVVDDLQRTIRGGEDSSTHALSLGGRTEIAQNPGSDPMTGVGGRDRIGTGAARREEPGKKRVACSRSVAERVDRWDGHGVCVAFGRENEGGPRSGRDDGCACALERFTRVQSEGTVLETVEHHGIGSGGTHQFVEGLRSEEAEVSGARASQHEGDASVANLGEELVDRRRQGVLRERRCGDVDLSGAVERAGIKTRRATRRPPIDELCTRPLADGRDDDPSATEVSTPDVDAARREVVDEGMPERIVAHLADKARCASDFGVDRGNVGRAPTSDSSRPNGAVDPAHGRRVKTNQDLFEQVADRQQHCAATVAVVAG